MIKSVWLTWHKKYGTVVELDDRSNPKLNRSELLINFISFAYKSFAILVSIFIPKLPING